jgi:CRISPR-associated endonuclease/helicase Cas3
LKGVEPESIRPNDPVEFPPGFEFRKFQRDVAEFDSDSAPASRLTLAVAGCGSGKSLAAYLWARRRCQAWADEGRTNFRFIFTLPTTGTTTEHFKDYVLNSLA